MASALDVLGSLLQGGMKGSTASRVEHSMGEQGVGGVGGNLGQILGGAKPNAAAPVPQGGVGNTGGLLGDVLGSVLGNRSALKIGGLGALAGAILARISHHPASARPPDLS